MTLLACCRLHAQNEVLDDINAQLRRYFSPLSRPASNYPFLYDMAAHQTDSIYFQTACTQPGTTAAWYKVYEEMYHAAYDTTSLTDPETVFYRGNEFYSDTIPIGIMRFSHYVLKPDAMTTGDYFVFDTVNNILSDLPGRPSSPYIESGIFMAAPTVEQCRHRNPVFRIDPDLIFYDAINAGAFTGSSLQIDFGDGAGFISFDPVQVTNYEVTYADSGEHQIMVRLGTKDGSSVYSRSVIGTGLSLRPTPPDHIYEYPGIRAGFYGACNATPNSGKLVIYVSGIDLMDPFDNEPGVKSLSRTVEDIYEEMIHKNQIVQLKNQGYNFLVVDWERSNIDIRFNALYLVNLLHHLKCDMAPTDDQQFVVIAESLGGIASRFALTYMETSMYREGNGALFFEDEKDPNNIKYLQQHPGIRNIPITWALACNPAKMHNTRLFIAFDSPHQGANIPISIQLAYSGALSTLSRFFGRDLEQLAIRNNLFLSAQASQQLLIYHYTTQQGTGMYKSYTSAPDKDRFFSQLQGLGNYPQYAKVMLLSDGALKGQGQVNVNTGKERTPNDRLLDFGALISAKVLWIRVPVFRCGLQLYTNPSGAGKVAHVDAGVYSIKIKLKWFGIKISNNYNAVFADQDEGTTNVLPLCTAAGGLNGIKPTSIGPTSGLPVSGYNAPFGLFSTYTIERDANGCSYGGVRAGIGGFLSANLNYGYCTDGMHFNFIPTQSALDYGTLTPYYANPPLGHDIEADPMTDKLNTYMKPGVAVIMGWASNSKPYLRDNRNYPHLVWRNDNIYNLTGMPNTTQYPYTYYSCRGTSDTTERGIINMEIGDEELYIENRVLPWVGDYQTEYTIRVNERNPHYIYLSQPLGATSVILNGIYSREADFITIQNPFNGTQGLARFITDGTNTPAANQPAFEIGAGTTIPNHGKVDAELLICCRNYLGRRQSPFLALKDIKETAALPAAKYLKLYPNPVSGRQLTLGYSLPGNAPAVVTIYNATGQPVLRRTLPAHTNGPATVRLILPGLSAAMYLLRLTSGREILQSKFIINQ